MQYSGVGNRGMSVEAARVRARDRSEWRAVVTRLWRISAPTSVSHESDCPGVGTVRGKYLWRVFQSGCKRGHPSVLPTGRNGPGLNPGQNRRSQMVLCLVNRFFLMLSICSSCFICFFGFLTLMLDHPPCVGGKGLGIWWWWWWCACWKSLVL